MKNSPTRRQFMLGTVGAGMALLAGCSDEDGNSSNFTDGDELRFEEKDVEWEKSMHYDSTEIEGDIEVALDNRRTDEDTLLVYLQTVAPQSNYELSIEEVIYSTREENNEEVGVIEINSSTDELDGAGATVITPLSAVIELSNVKVEDVEYVTAEITDGWDDIHTLELDACTCLMGLNEDDEEKSEEN